jgi:hypothetical protein
MNNLSSSKLEMYQKVQGFLELHTELTTKLPAFAPHITEFNDAVTKLLTLNTEMNADIKVYREQKDSLKSKSTELVFKIATAYFLSVKSAEKPELIDTYNLSYPALKALNDTEFYTHCNRIINLVKDKAAELGNYNITQENITNLSEWNDAFLKIIEQPKVQIAMRKASNERMKSELTRIDNILYEKIDPLVNLLKSEEEFFFNAYYNVRTVEHSGSRKKPDYEGTVIYNSQTVVFEIEYDKDRTLKISNSGEVPLNFSLSTQADTMDGLILTVNPKSSIQRNCDKLNTLPANFLLVKNSDLKKHGEYKIRIE